MSGQGWDGLIEDVLIVGAGQGGLSVSWFLTQAGIPHSVLDRGEIGHAWKAYRWDSFCLVTPNWSIRLLSTSRARRRAPSSSCALRETPLCSLRLCRSGSMTTYMPPLRSSPSWMLRERRSFSASSSFRW